MVRKTNICYFFRIFCLILISIKSFAKNDCNLIVKSNKGIYYGCRQHISTESLTNVSDQFQEIYTFKGIPFALPPIGKLRFQKPLPLEFDRMTEINASEFQKSCKYHRLVIKEFRNFHDSSEDCLYLNIFTPSLDRNSNLPVIVYIPGGVFLFDGSSHVTAEQLILRDVVVVTISYRLGIFGFLCTDREDAPGNVGLWDQAMAINWTNKNIKSFGGNPDDITLIGSGAGAVSVTSHIVSNVSRHYFKSAIIQSGSSLTNVWLRSKEYSTRVAKRLTKFVKCDRSHDYMECLRDKSAEELLSAQSSAIFWNWNTSDANPWYSGIILEFVQCFGDEFLPENVFKLLESGAFDKDIRIMIGHTSVATFAHIFDLVKFGLYSPDAILNTRIAKFEIKKFMINNESFDEIVSDQYIKGFKDFLILSPSAYFERQRLRAAVAHSLSDYLVVCPTVLFGKYLVNNKNFNGKVFQYYMSYANEKSICKSSLWCRNTQLDELPLLFGQPFSMKGFSDLDKKMSSVIMDIFTDFVKTKEAPAVNGNLWPPYFVNEEGMVSLNYMELDSKDLGQTYFNRYIGNNGFNPKVIHNCEFWEPILRSLF